MGNQSRVISKHFYNWGSVNRIIVSFNERLARCIYFGKLFDKSYAHQRETT